MQHARFPSGGRVIWVPHIPGKYKGLKVWQPIRESFYRCDWDTQSIFVQPEGLPQLLVLHCSLLVPDTIVPFPLFFCTLILFPLEDYWKFEASSLKDWPKPSFIWLNTLAARSCISHPSFNSPALISMSFSRMLNRPDVVTTLSVGTKGKLVIAYRKSWFPEQWKVVCMNETTSSKQGRWSLAVWASPLHFLSQRKWRCSHWPLVQQWIPGHFQENPWSSSLTRHPVLVRHTRCIDPNKHQEASCGMHPNFWSSAAMVEKTIDQQTTPGETTFPPF